MGNTPPLEGIFETALYVDDLDRAVRFYQALFDLTILFCDARGCALNVADRQVLLLFRKGASSHPLAVSSGMIPPHDGDGPVHVGFAIAAEALAAWEQHLHDLEIPIESRITWPRGGVSLYFRDPDDHLLELVTPGVWLIR